LLEVRTRIKKNLVRWENRHLEVEGRVKGGSGLKPKEGG